MNKLNIQLERDLTAEQPHRERLLKKLEDLLNDPSGIREIIPIKIHGMDEIDKFVFYHADPKILKKLIAEIHKNRFFINMLMKNLIKWSQNDNFVFKVYTYDGSFELELEQYNIEHGIKNVYSYAHSKDIYTFLNMVNTFIEGLKFNQKKRDY
jgi:hypothetical protein